MPEDCDILRGCGVCGCLCSVTVSGGSDLGGEIMQGFSSAEEE